MHMPFFTSKESRLFRDSPLHFVLTNRYHGISLPPYQSLNLAYHVDDIPTYVTHNRNYIMQQYYNNKTLLYLDQIHSTTIFTTYAYSKTNIDSIPHIYNMGHTKPQQSYNIHAHKHAQYHEMLVGKGDGIICNTPHFTLMSMVADCNPILVYAPSHNVFALLHAGRLGVCHKILTHAIMLLIKHYAVDIHDILIFIGASIRKCCYAIGSDLAMQIANKHGKQYIIKVSDTYKLDMLGLLYSELMALGITPSQVETHPSCTCCDSTYFSYRREATTGRFGLFASLMH